MPLWGGRFKSGPDALLKEFGDSFRFDRRLFAADIRGSIAYASALEQAGLITADELTQLVTGLELVCDEFENDTFQTRPGDEDIHTAVERRLGELTGAVAGKLHTGRSRNDQVATDLRLYLLGEIVQLRSSLRELQTEVINKAEAHLDIVMPGYTHLQQAQPVLFSHWLMSYFWKFQRDRERLASLRTRVNVMPLGAGALAGNPFDLDREALSRNLGFARTSQNSIDAVGDRDYVVEFMAWAALLQVHLSSLAEELVLWSTREFGFVELDERYSTGSSLMPQKKNPDSLELVRGKSGRLIGHLAGMLATLKGLPTAYNKDLQEDKEALFDTIDTLLLELPLVAGVIQSLTIKGERMRDTMDSSMLATDLADYLVRRGVPFRESHHLAGQAVLRAEELGMPLESLSLEEFQAIHPAFDPDVGDVFDFQHSIECRSTEGGTATDAVRVQIASARAALETQNSNGEWRK